MSPSTRSRAQSSPTRRTRRTAALVAMAGSTAFLLSVGQTANAGIVPTVPLATAANYSVLASSTVTNTGPSVIGQSVGLSPGSAIVGFPPGMVLPPATIQAANGVTLQARSDLTAAYVNAAGRAVEFTLPNDLVGQTLAPGVYEATAHGPLSLSGDLVLDGQNNADAVFIFQTDSTLITSTGSTISLINGASECNVFWQVGSSATLGSGSFFVGNILALTSITVESSTVVHGRALARNGAVTLDNNVFTQPSCTGSTDQTPTATAPATTVATAPTTAPSGDTTGAPGDTTIAPGDTTGAPGDTTIAPGDTTASSVPTSDVTATTGVTPTTSDIPDLTLPRTGTTVGVSSNLGIVAVLLGLAAMLIARRRHPT